MILQGWGGKDNFVVPELVDMDEDDRFGRDYAMEGKTRKKLSKEGAGSSGKDKKKHSKGERYSSNGGKVVSGSKILIDEERHVFRKDVW